ncbi:MAG: spore protease YyaC [Firmicutes bacterium]|nr:spore protease YyaC [Bacillota bacterium]
MQIEARTFYFKSDCHLIISDFIRTYAKNPCLIFCIGTDRYIGDCLGPLTGTFLSKLHILTPIFGTLDNPIHAVNLSKNIIEAKIKYPYHTIIAIDACLGTKDNVGCIQIKKTPIYPGKGVGKKLPPVGDISIVGIVDSADRGEFLNFHNIRLGFIMNIAEVITRGIYHAFSSNL